jgi:thiol-disulfide isomerase/thioredoxin
VPIVGIVFGVIAVLLVAVFLSGGGSSTDEDRIAAEAAPIEVLGTGLARAPQAAGTFDPGVGATAPEVVGTDYAGNTMEIRHTGTPKAIVFLAHWCPHCQNEAPRVQAWLDQTGGVDGVDVVSVSTQYDPARGNWPPSEWLSDLAWTPPLIRDDADSSAWINYGAGGFPYWVFLDGNGTVVLRLSGEQEVAGLQALMEGLRNI